jgi:hypothetical protein
MDRFVIVELTHSDSNPRFDIGVAYLRLIILSLVSNIPVDNETLLMTDFMNLKINPQMCSYG